MNGCWKLASVLLALVFGAVSTGSAIAQRSSRGVGSRPIGASHPGGGYSHVRGYGHPGGRVGGYGHGYGWGGGPRWGLAVGAPLFWPGYYGGYYSYPYPYAYPYPAPAYDTPWPAATPSGAYVEQDVPQAAPAPAPANGDWYYCADSNAYYPYVRECPAGWQRVPSIPPR